MTEIEQARMRWEAHPTIVQDGRVWLESCCTNALVHALDARIKQLEEEKQESKGFSTGGPEDPCGDCGRDELLAHEKQTHETLGAILGNDTSLKDAALRMKAERDELLAEVERWKEWETAIGRIWQLDGVGPKTLQSCIDSMSELITQETERAEAAEAEVERADAEIKRLNDICDRLAAAGRSHD